MEIKKVGIVGCGIMGAGVSQICARTGYQVVVSEMNNELLNKGLAKVDYLIMQAIEKGKLSPDDKKAVWSRIQGTVNIQDFYDCDIVIETVPENIDQKRKVFIALDSVCSQNAILATNTGSLSVIGIAKATKRLDKVLGLHFFNPVTSMRLLEIVKTRATSNETLEIGKIFGTSLGKTVVIAPDVPGFIVNRLMAPFRMNAIRMLEAGLATKEDIDTAIKLGTGMPFGPLEVGDIIGLDTVLAAVNAMYQEYKDPQYKPPILLKNMVSSGWLGVKTGKGFYEYQKES